MAPEIVQGGEGGHDMAVDWWSLGVLLFELLTCESPFAPSGEDNSQKDISRYLPLPCQPHLLPKLPPLPHLTSSTSPPPPPHLLPHLPSPPSPLLLISPPPPPLFLPHFLSSYVTLSAF